MRPCTMASRHACSSVRSACLMHVRAPSSMHAMSNLQVHAGLLLASVRDPDPVVFFEAKMQYRTVVEDVPVGDYAIPLGQARVARAGADITLVGWGQQVAVLERAVRPDLGHAPSVGAPRCLQAPCHCMPPHQQPPCCCWPVGARLAACTSGSRHANKLWGRAWWFLLTCRERACWAAACVGGGGAGGRGHQL